MDGSDTYKVLLPIDVGNCFLFANEQEKASFLNAGSGVEGGNSNMSKEIVSEINGLVEKLQPDCAIFTRDLHPINHISFAGEEGRAMDPIKGIWPIHCRNPTRGCKSRVGDIDDKDYSTKHEMPKQPITIGDFMDKDGYNLNIQVIATNLAISQDEVKALTIPGTELSYYFYETPLGKTIHSLNEANRVGNSKIGLTSTKEESGAINVVDDEDGKTLSDIAWSDAVPIKHITASSKSVDVLTLTKGERCTDESYSAFNYHITYETTDPANPVMRELPIDEQNSTGLWEWILANVGKKNKIEITVCGLLGNVCVFHTILQGIAMWNKVYAASRSDIDVSFVFSLMGTRFTDRAPPNTNKPYDGLINIDMTSKQDIIRWMNMLNTKNNGFQQDIETDLPVNKITEFSFLSYSGNKMNGTLPFYKENVVATVDGGNKQKTRRRRPKTVRRKRHIKSCKCGICMFGGKNSRRGNKKHKRTNRK